MYNSELKSDVAQFLALHTESMARVRDNLPAGTESFKLYHRDRELEWYEFWDLIAEVRPIGFKLTTNMFTITFDEYSFKWVCDVNSDSPTLAPKVRVILEALNTNFIRSSIINSWELHRQYG